MNGNVDIIFDEERKDFKPETTDKWKGQNICMIQLGHLNGGREIGIDFSQFVKGELEFSMDTFKAHIIQQLTMLNCSVKQVNVDQDDLTGAISIGVR